MLRRLLVVLVGFALLPAAAHAARLPAGSSIGPRFGFSVDPDQFVIGGQFSTGELAPDISFDPNLELGFGDHQTVIALNLDGHYHFDVHNSQWQPYLGFGVGVNFISVDVPAPFEDTSDTQVGGNFIIGTTVPTRSGSQFLAEMKLGLGDIPTLKILAGWHFPLR